MQVTYRKTQRGWIINLVFIPILLFFAAILYYQEVLGKSLGDRPAPSWFYLAFILLFLILMALFSTLTVTGFPNYIEIKFGIGLIRKKFYYKDIRSCSVQKNPFLYGWGIRKIPGGWLYNVSGSMSVQLDMKDGKMYRIGTAEPQKLGEFIKTRLSLFGGS
ncbi:MAG: hypothetical protein KAW02_06600 [candidate division Zixibacteria bacterium]|nr:hypothetical protein [candidate division Zixibacteria bacterium]